MLNVILTNYHINTLVLKGEGIADVYAALRMNDSCIGRGFFTSGDGCTGKYHFALVNMSL